jgi:GrpB-like predicted nucleotidyltransferase (UPF0157 family)
MRLAGIDSKSTPVRAVRTLDLADSERLEELYRVLVHGPTPVTAVIADADPNRPAQYDAYATALQLLLGERMLMVEHIGSTSVPGLAAKPVIDIAAGIEDPDDEPAYLPDLVTSRWELRVREPGHRRLRADPAVQRSDWGPTLSANLHCYRPSSPEISQYLNLRDRLRADPAARYRYADLKRSLATRRWADMNLYADAKGPLIRELLAEPPNGSAQSPPDSTDHTGR